MTLEDFNYELPKELIAQSPLLRRDESRLLVVDKKTGEIEHKIFNEIIDYLTPGDVLVINNTKVLPARLFGIKDETGAKIEILLLDRVEDDKWNCLASPVKRLNKGTIISFGEDILSAKVMEILEDGRIIVEFRYEGIFYEILNDLGQMPLPPYIKETLKEQERYQTVYAKELGSAAAPTAGLHFTKKLLAKLESIGIIVAAVTLHVGIGTFRPVTVEKLEEHKMHSEYYEMDKGTAEILNRVKDNGNKIYSVGTTSTRTLETIYSKYNEFRECKGYTDIFIYPGYQFKSIDGLITNFHLPKSTLLMLVCALASKPIIMKAYEDAIAKKYRFFSFGDAMLIK